MLKSILHIALSSLLIFTILAPPVLSLLEIEVISITMQEEKKEKKEKELEEKTIFYNGTLKMMTSIDNQGVNLFTFYNAGLHDYTSKIILPPPELRD